MAKTRTDQAPLPLAEVIPRGSDSSFAVRSFQQRGWSMRLHNHAEHELTLIVAGEGRRFVGDSVEPFGPGELVLLGSGLPHCWHAERRRKAWCRSLVVQFRDDCLGPGFFDLPELRAVRRLLTRAQRGLVFAAGPASAATAAMADIPVARRPGALIDILLTLAQARTRPLATRQYVMPTRQGEVDRIDRVIRWLEGRYLEPLSLRQAAATIGLEPTSFCRFFRRHTGRSFLAYLHELRIGHACRLLMQTTDPITEVAMSSGFSNLAHFNRLMRRLRGMTPRQYRQAMRGGGA
jgi:AraC-like DNA-binding protein